MPVTTTDPYTTLGVPQDAPVEECDRARKRLLRRWHPDFVADGDGREEANRRTQQINQAWDLITNDIHRIEKSEAPSHDSEPPPPPSPDPTARPPTRCGWRPVAGGVAIGVLVLGMASTAIVGLYGMALHHHSRG